MVLLWAFEITMVVIEEVVCWHWYIRKTYQTSIYRFNTYHELNLWLKYLVYLRLKLEWVRWYNYNYWAHYEFLCVRISIMDFTVKATWYTYCWSSWTYLTFFLYYDSRVRDLGPSHEIFDYCDTIPVSFYKTFGLRLLLPWSCWTYTANSVFIRVIFFLLYELSYLKNFYWYWWCFTFISYIPIIVQYYECYKNTLFSCIETNQWY